jgi:hypothetical protein
LSFCKEKVGRNVGLGSHMGHFLILEAHRVNCMGFGAYMGDIIFDVLVTFLGLHLFSSFDGLRGHMTHFFLPTK